MAQIRTSFPQAKDIPCQQCGENPFPRWPHERLDRHICGECRDENSRRKFAKRIGSDESPAVLLYNRVNATLEWIAHHRTFTSRDFQRGMEFADLRQTRRHIHAMRELGWIKLQRVRPGGEHVWMAQVTITKRDPT